ncbi:para-hydroxybenzoate-- mitochondrial [Lasius niger]|uniref:Para-hydroxybenzoate--mitochondrial n=1 Tax=Lasius niger TaxID=67767 RepID=A0A0J7KQR0_LASNI|nr:para-hydroxybenzoate-- mitochondrial [Lasius niger]
MRKITHSLLRTDDALTYVKLALFQQKRCLSIAAKLVNNASPKVQPYMKLMRIDKPIGSWLLFWPCGWSIAMAAPVGALPDLQMLALFGTGAFIMRGAGCTINDMWDQDIDKMDRVDDILLGIKSTAIKFGDYTKFYLSGFGMIMIASLIASGLLTTQTWPYYTSVGLIAMHISNQIYTLNINNPTDCAKKFISNHRVGMILFAGIVLGNLMKKLYIKEESKIEEETEHQTVILDETKNSKDL